MIKCQELIVTDLEKRQDHTGAWYLVLQVYDKEGNLIAENDHHELSVLVREKGALLNEITQLKNDIKELKELKNVPRRGDKKT